MKITPKQYAVLLYELTKAVKKSELKEVVQSFIRQLTRGRALPLLPRILELYNSYWNAREGVVDVEVVSAREASTKIIQAIEQHVGRGFSLAKSEPKGSHSVELVAKIDPSVLGGARIRIGDYMIDDTLKTRLLNLKQKLYGRQN